MKYATPLQLLRRDLKQHEQALMILQTHVIETPEHATNEMFINMDEINAAIMLLKAAIKKLEV